MILNVLYRLLIVRQLFLFIAIVVAEVAGVEHVVTQRVKMASQRLHVMWPDEPPLVLHAHLILDILEIVVWRQVQLVACRDVIVHELSAILYQTEALIWIVLLASLIVDEVLLDVSCFVGQLFLLFIDLVLSLLIANNPRLRLAKVFKSAEASLTNIVNVEFVELCSILVHELLEILQVSLAIAVSFAIRAEPRAHRFLKLELDISTVRSLSTSKEVPFVPLLRLFLDLLGLLSFVGDA